jgi:hypothetical protein
MGTTGQSWRDPQQFDDLQVHTLTMHLSGEVAPRLDPVGLRDGAVQQQVSVRVVAGEHLRQ